MLYILIQTFIMLILKSNINQMSGLTSSGIEPKCSNFRSQSSDSTQNSTKKSQSQLFNRTLLRITKQQKNKMKILSNSSTNLILSQHQNNLFSNQKLQKVLSKTFKVVNKQKKIQCFQPDQKKINQNDKKQKLKRKPRICINQVPSIGAYDPDPQTIMKKLSKNLIFRKEKTSHSTFCSSSKLLDLHQSQSKKPHFSMHSSLLMKNKYSSSLQQKVKKQQRMEAGLPFNKIKCFQMKHQLPRYISKPVTPRYKASQDIDIDFVEREYGRSQVLEDAYDPNELQNIYLENRQKYHIKPPSALKYINIREIIRSSLNKAEY